MALLRCASCNRHLLPGDGACPFCAAPRSRPWLAAAVVGSALTLAACAPSAVYGGPPPRPPTDPNTNGTNAGEPAGGAAADSAADSAASEDATPTDDAPAPDQPPASPAPGGSSLGQRT